MGEAIGSPGATTGEAEKPMAEPVIEEPAAPGTLEESGGNPAAPVAPAAADTPATGDSAERAPVRFHFVNFNTVAETPVEVAKPAAVATPSAARVLGLLASRNPADFATAETAAAARAAANPADAFWAYCHAMSLYKLNRTEAAKAALTVAILLERDHGVPVWGSRLERVQGSHRIWVERARRAVR